MSCSCREIKNKAGPLKWLLSGKSCSGCHRLVCQFCAPNNDTCRDCKLRINIKLDRNTLIRMSEEDLIDLAEANGVTITPGVLLKSELVTLILLTCQSFKIPTQAQAISLSEEFKNAEELNITKVLHLLEENPKTLSILSVHELAEVMRSLVMKENHRGETEQDITKAKFMLNTDTQRQNLGLNPYQETVINDSNSHPNKMTARFYTTNDISKKFSLEQNTVNKLNMHDATAESLFQLTVKELINIMHSLGMKKPHYACEKSEIVQNILKYLDNSNWETNTLKSVIPTTCEEYCTSDTAATQNQDLLATISKSHSCENGCTKNIASNCEESDTLQTCVKKPQIEYHMLDGKAQLVDVIQKEEPISLESITDNEEVHLLRNSQLKYILESHGINTASFHEKDTLPSTVLQLWLEKRSSQPEASLRVKEITEAALPSEDAKEKFIKVQKRRCIYVSNSDKETSANCQQDSNNKETSPDCHSSSKKKKIGHKEYTCSSETDSNCVSRKSLGNIATPRDIENLSVDDLSSILEAHSIVHEKTCDKWSLAFQVLKLWYSDKCKETNENDNFCIICMEEPVSCTILECGHTGTCFTCSEELKECPICRQAVTRVIRIFKP